VLALSSQEPDQGVDLALAKCCVEDHQLVEITVVGIRPVDDGARAAGLLDAYDERIEAESTAFGR
jgi:hypothetical protein